MTKSKKMQLLFFSLIPVGIISLIFSIKLVQKTFSGDLILEVPYSKKIADFVLPKPGTYSIWHKGQFLTKAPLDEFIPEITNISTGNKVKLRSILLRPNSANRRTARMQLFRFSAPAGKYILDLVEGSSISAVENSIIQSLPVKKVDYDKYFIQIRESQPLVLFLTGIVLISLSGCTIICGLVIGILANQIFIT